MNIVTVDGLLIIVIGCGAALQAALARRDLAADISFALAVLGLGIAAIGLSVSQL